LNEKWHGRLARDHGRDAHTTSQRRRDFGVVGYYVDLVGRGLELGDDVVDQRLAGIGKERFFGAHALGLSGGGDDGAEHGWVY
jgi:hypothetical protein